MTWIVVPDVDDGQSFGGAATNAYRDAIMEIQTLLGPVRRRDARNTTTYTVGDTDLIPNSTVESVGGITTVGGVLTVPTDGDYLVGVAFNPVAGHGSDDSIGGAVSRAGSPYFLNPYPLQDTATGNIVSWGLWLYAGDTVKFTLTVVTAAFDATWETYVARTSHVLP